jgi:serine/threonine protein kinase
MLVPRGDGESPIPQVKLLDFGVAKIRSDDRPENTDGFDAQKLSTLATAVGAMMGTPAYMSPEQIKASPNIDHRLRLAAPVTLDLDGDTDVYVFVFSLPGASDAARDVLAMLPLPVPVAGYDGFILNPLNGIAGIFSDDGPGSPQTWGTGATGSAYLDRGRVWLDGTIATTSGSGALGTLPTGHRPAATVTLPVTVTNNGAGTPATIPATITVTSAGVATLASTVTLTGNIATPLTGLSFQVAS